MAIGDIKKRYCEAPVAVGCGGRGACMRAGACACLHAHAHVRTGPGQLRGRPRGPAPAARRSLRRPPRQFRRGASFAPHPAPPTPEFSAQHVPWAVFCGDEEGFGALKVYGCTRVCVYVCMPWS